MRALYCLLVIGATLATSAVGLGAQAATTSRPANGLAPQTTADSVYLTELAALQAGDTTVDLSRIRRQFALTTFYDPYDTRVDDRKQRMFARLDAQDAVGAAAIADSLLNTNYLDAEAHVGAGVSATARGDSTAAARHFALARGILRSIQSTGDGRTKDRPLLVLSPSEEYSYLGALGLRRAGFQALAECSGGRACDRVEVAPRDGGDKFDLFFDISLPTAHLERRFKRAEKPD